MAPLAGPVLALLAAFGAGCGVPGPTVDNLPERVDFALHVRPILSDRCFKCHGPDGAARKSDLRLDREDVVFKRLASGATAVVRAGHAAASSCAASSATTRPY